MLCEISSYGGFLPTWLSLTVIGVTLTGSMSAWPGFWVNGQLSHLSPTPSSGAAASSSFASNAIASRSTSPTPA